MGLLSKLFGQGPKADEEKSAEQTEKESARNFDVLKFDGIRAMQMGKFSYASRCLAEALAIKNDFSARLHLAQCYAAQNSLDLALDQLKQASEMDPQSIEPLLMTAQVASMKNDFQLMADASQAALSIDPARADANYWLGVSMAGLGDGISAIATLTKSIMSDENYQPSYLKRAEVLESMGQANEAMEDIDRLLGMDESNETYLAAKGRLLLMMNMTDDAEKIFSALIECNPFNTSAYLSKASLLASEKRFDEGIEILTEAIENNPEAAELYKMRGGLENEKGDSKLAVEDLKKALELEPKEGEKISGEFTSIEEEVNEKLRSINPFLQ